MTPASLEAPSPPFAFEAVRAPRWFGGLTIVLFALIMPIGYLGNEGDALVSGIGGAAALAFVLRRRAPPVGVMILAGLTLWAVASFAWSPMLRLQSHPHGYKQLEALTAPKLLIQLVVDSAFVAGALRLPADQRRGALQWMAWTLGGTTLVLVADAVAGGAIYNLFNHLFGKHDLTPDLAQRDAARGCYTVALFFWPAALFSARRTPLVAPIVVAAATAVSSVRLGEDAPAAALVVSMLVWAGMQVNARAGAWACMVGSAIYFLAAPLVFLPRGAAPVLAEGVGKASWQARLYIWRFASGLIAHKPLVGHGLDASRAYEPNIPMHPHDAALQLWLELGVPGALLGALFFGWLFYKIARGARQDPAWASAACATGTVYLFIGAISFGVWQEWWIGVGAAAAAACGMLQQHRRDVGADEPDTKGLEPL